MRWLWTRRVENIHLAAKTGHNWRFRAPCQDMWSESFLGDLLAHLASVECCAWLGTAAWGAPGSGPGVGSRQLLTLSFQNPRHYAWKLKKT